MSYELTSCPHCSQCIYTYSVSWGNHALRYLFLRNFRLDWIQLKSSLHYYLRNQFVLRTALALISKSIVSLRVFSNDNGEALMLLGYKYKLLYYDYLVILRCGFAGVLIPFEYQNAPHRWLCIVCKTLHLLLYMVSISI